MTTLVERLRDAEGGMHAHCKNDNERYKCDRGSCACAERHVEMLEEAASRMTAQEETIKKLREALEKIMHARGNPNSPVTNMGRSMMREIASDALADTGSKI